MSTHIRGFDWDKGNRAKCQKHGLSNAEIESALTGPIATFPDPKHSNSEARIIAIGNTAEGRMVLIIFTLRHRSESTLIRPISARYMHQKEIAHYEKALATSRNR